MHRVELYARVRRACHVEGMSIREASRVFGVDRKTVQKMLAFSVPPGYRRSKPPRRAKLPDACQFVDKQYQRLARQGRHSRVMDLGRKPLGAVDALGCDDSELGKVSP